MGQHPVFGEIAEFIPGLNMVPPMVVQAQNFRENEEFCLRQFGQFKRYKLIKRMPPAIIHQGYDDKLKQSVTLLQYIEIDNEDAGALAKETSILRSLNDESILRYLGMVCHKRGESIDRYLSFDTYEFFLSQLFSEYPETFKLPVIKCVVNQLLVGLKYLHERNIVHRDITPKNLVITEKGVLKISNFRSAKRLGEPSEMILTAEFRYQPVNVLLEDKTIYTADDIWSATCILAELLLKKKLFESKGKGELLNDIFSVLGLPGVNVWPEFAELPDYKYLDVMESHSYNFLDKYFEDKHLRVLQEGFTYDPDYRLSAEEFLGHSYFEEDPIPMTSKLFAGELHGKSFTNPVEYD